MDTFAFVASPGLVLWGDQRIMLNPGNAWYADDPFVLARPGLFSATPIEVSSTTGRPSPQIVPPVPPVPAEVEAAMQALAEEPVRRGPGRPRRVVA